MKKFLLRFYLVFEYLLSLVWFVLGTFLYLFLLMFDSDDINFNHGLEHTLNNIYFTSIYILMTYCLISSIRSTHKLLKGKSLTLINKIIMVLAVIIDIWLVTFALDFLPK